MMTTLRGFLLLVFLAGVPRPADAQMRPGAQDPPPQFLFYEAVNLLPLDTTRSRIDLHYRIDREFFVALTNADSGTSSRFRRRGEIAIELVDSMGVVRERELERIDLDEQSADRNPDQKQWVQGMASFEPVPGRYTISIEVTDLQSGRNHVEKNRSIVAAQFSSPAFETSTPLFLAGSPARTSPDTLLPLNFGGEILFGAPAALYLEWDPGSVAETTAAVRYSLAIAEGSAAKQEVWRTDSLSSVPVRMNSVLDPAKKGRGFSYAVRGAVQHRSAAVVLPFPAEQLPLRSYVLTVSITHGRRKREISRPFRTVWPDMPNSMKDVDMALESLRYIATARELDSLRSGSFETRRNNLEGFWKSRAQGSALVATKLMTQYYRRVDHAVRSFGTLRQPDGSRSDRGRIYVLYGPPTRTDRSLDPASAFTETWVYERLKKKFIFVDEAKNGTYILTATTTP